MSSLRALPIFLVLLTLQIETGVASPGVANSIWQAEGRLPVGDSRAVAATALDLVRAEAAISASVSLEPRRRARVVGGGEVIVVAARFAGLPIVGGDSVVRTDGRGRARWARFGRASIAASFSSTPTIAQERALSAAGLAASSGAPAELAIAMIDDSARLVWLVRTPLDLASMRADLVIVDAGSGEVLERRNRVATAGPQARVFATNPVESSLIDVELGALEGRASLASDALAAFSCSPICDSDSPSCDFVELAALGGDGSYLAIEPAGDRDPSDSFAELSAFYHVDRALRFASDTLEIPVARGPMPIMVNVEAATSCDAPRQPFNNAFFLSSGNISDPDLGDGSLTFGQGDVDFAYDGDIAYHEFGHALLATLSPTLGIGVASDELGWDTTSASLHEAFGDLVTYLITGDPEIGEHAASSVGLPHLRDLKQALRCPDDIFGEQHEDSVILTSAIVSVAEQIAADPTDRARFAAAVLVVLAGLVELDDFEVVSRLLAAELAIEFGEEASGAALELFAERGLLGCNQRVVDGSVPRARMMSPSFASTAPLQFRIEVLEPAEAIEVHIGKLENAEEMRVRVLAADRPIRDTDEDAATGTGSFEGDTDLVVRVKGPFAPGIHHIQLLAGGFLPILFEDVRFEVVPDTGGCGCGVASAAHGSPAGWLLLILAFIGGRFSIRRPR